MSPKISEKLHIHEISPRWLPKQDLNKDNTNKQPTVEKENLTTLNQELPKNTEKQSLPQEKSTSVGDLIPNGQPSKYRTSTIVQTEQVVFVYLGI